MCKKVAAYKAAAFPLLLSEMDFVYRNPMNQLNMCWRDQRISLRIRRESEDDTKKCGSVTGDG